MKERRRGRGGEEDGRGGAEGGGGEGEGEGDEKRQRFEQQLEEYFGRDEELDEAERYVKAYLRERKWAQGEDEDEVGGGRGGEEYVRSVYSADDA